jgi:hypothetical protein
MRAGTWSFNRTCGVALDEHPVVVARASSHSEPVRRVLLAVLVVFAVSAPAAHASCAAGVAYHDGFYYGTAIAVHDAAPLSGGYIPGCDDAVAVDPETGARLTPLAGPTPVELHSIPGLPVRMGVAYNGRAALAPGWLPEVAGHPLHKSFRAAKPGSCGPAWHLRGKVQAPPLPGSPVSIQTAAVAFKTVTLTGSTKVRGLSRGGYPYLAAGDPVDAVVRRCEGALVAKDLTRAA